MDADSSRSRSRERDYDSEEELERERAREVAEEGARLNERREEQRCAEEAAARAEAERIASNARPRARNDATEDTAAASTRSVQNDTDRMPNAILYWFNNGEDHKGLGGAFDSLDDFAKTVKFINPSNGPLHIGLAITEEKGLDDADKLQVPDPVDLAKSNGPLSIRIGQAADPSKQATIALLVAHRIATVLGIANKDIKSLPASERHIAFLVTAAYAVCSLIGLYTRVDKTRARDKSVIYCGGFISE